MVLLEFLHDLDRELKMGKVWISLDSAKGKVPSIAFKWYPDKTHMLTHSIDERELVMRPSFDFARIVASQMVFEFRRMVTIEAQNRDP